MYWGSAVADPLAMSQFPGSTVYISSLRTDLRTSMRTQTLL